MSTGVASGMGACWRVRLALVVAYRRRRRPVQAADLDLFGWSSQRKTHYLDVLCAFHWARRVGKGFVPLGWPDAFTSES